jgi:hypothetical protein
MVLRWTPDATPNVAPRIRRYELAPKLVPTTSQTASDSLAQPGSESQDLAGIGIRMREPGGLWRESAGRLALAVHLRCDFGTGLVLPLFVVFFGSPDPRG